MDDDYTFLRYCPYCGSLEHEPIETENIWEEKFRCKKCGEEFIDFS